MCFCHSFVVVLSRIFVSFANEPHQKMNKFMLRSMLVLCCHALCVYAVDNLYFKYCVYLKHKTAKKRIKKGKKCFSFFSVGHRQTETEKCIYKFCK